jgi:two-component system KDP operon response regulator KdpE
MTERSGTNHPPDILLIEADAEVRKLLSTAFSAEEYCFREAATAADGLSQVVHRCPDLVVLELVLADSDGIEVIRQLRQQSRTLPIIVLSVRSLELDKIMALDAGADDFVTKPFAVGELLARLRRALRRSKAPSDDAASSVFRTGDIEVNLAKRRILVAGT